ncbi:flotillin [bacterium]|nr:flotillin [bacterium]
MGLSQLLIGIGIIAVILVLVCLAFAKLYRKVGPNEVLIISGGRKRTITEPDGTVRKIGYRARIGGGTFVIPFMEKVETLPLEVINFDIPTPEVITKEGVPVKAVASVQLRIKTDEHSILTASEQFLSTGSQGIRDVTYSILEGYMRGVMAQMTVEEISQNRNEFSSKVEEFAAPDFTKMGLMLIAFSLKDVTDTMGYLEALGKPRIAQVKKDAVIAQAETDRESVIKASEARKEAEIARLNAEAMIAGAAWKNEVKKAESLIEVNKKKAEADMAYELERAFLSQQLKKEEYALKMIAKNQEIQLADLEIQRKEKELESTINKTADARKYQSLADADAESYRIEIEARSKAEALRLEGEAQAESIKYHGEAEAEAMSKKADAFKKYNDAALTQMIVNVLPNLASAISEPLSKVDKIIMIGNQDDIAKGAHKITGQVANVIAQLPEIVNSLTGVDLRKLIEKKLSDDTNA